MSRKSKKKTRPGNVAAKHCQPDVPFYVKHDWTFGLILALAVIIAYQPAWHGEFIWDDDYWTTGISNLLQDVSGLRSMWSDPTALQQYYPLTGTTFWLDYHFWKFWTLPYHVENIILHLISAFLFWKLLRKLEMPGAWLAAGIFALHPVMVESVAWITERKNVLSMVFFLGALLAYGRFNSFWKTDNDPRRKWGAYILVFFLFLAALLAKTATLSFPAVVLLICWWKNGRCQWRKDVLPLLPFFALAIGLGLLTAWLEKNHVGAAGADFTMTFPERCLVAGRAPWFYLGKLLWPENLCFIYPRWKPDAGSWWQWLFPIATLGVLAALFLLLDRKKIGRGPIAAVFFFIGTLFPVLGFMSAYGMRYSFVWDHWVYLPSLGLIALFAGLVSHLARHLNKPEVLYGFVVILLPTLAVLTWQQCVKYGNIETIWRVTIDQNPDAWMAHNNLGSVLRMKGNVDEAIVQYQQSLQINPAYANAHNNLGNALLQQGRVDEAIVQFQQALQIEPGNAIICYNLGNVLFQMDRVDEAIAYFRQALQIKPDYAEAHNNLGNALLQKCSVSEAIIYFRQALQIRPDYLEAKNNLAWVLATASQASLRNGNQAVELAQQANQIAGEQNPGILHILAAAYAEAGRFNDARRCAQKAIELARAGGQSDLVEQLNREMKLYTAGFPFHQGAK